MKEYTKTQHLIDALEYILEVATTEGSTCETKLKEITGYCKDLAEITTLYKEEDPEYEEKKKEWPGQMPDSPRLRPKLVDDNC